MAIKIINVEPGPYGYCNNNGPTRGPLRSLVPVKDGMVYLLPDFAVPMRPMIGVNWLRRLLREPRLGTTEATLTSTRSDAEDYHYFDRLPENDESEPFMEPSAVN